MRRAYLTDLSDAEWSYLKPHLPGSKPNCRPRIHSPRQILNAIFYLARSGCAWRLLPHDFPPWKSVFHYFRAWRIERASKESADTITLVDTQSGEEFEVPKTAFLDVIGSFDDEAEVDPQIAPLLDRLDRLVDRDSGEPFWLEDMTHTGKAAANAEKEEEHTD